MKIIPITLLLIIGFSGFVAGQNDCQRLHNDTLLTNISVTQARDTISAYASNPWFVILDVRTPSEYATKHLEKGVNIDYYSADFSDKLSTLNKGKVYLLHCAGGSRSAPVLIMMKNMHFQKVYNMIGGINAWVNASYPTFTTTAPIPGICDTIVRFNEVPVNETDSVKLTITNAANDILTFSTITDLTGTSFSTNFETTTTLSGAKDYSFYIYYSPVNPLPDSVIFKVETNGGEIDLTVHGTAKDITTINHPEHNDNSIFNDAVNRRIVIKSEHLSLKTIYYLYDSSGKLIISSDLTNGNTINYSGYEHGIYLLRLLSSEANRSYKLLLLPK